MNKTHYYLFKETIRKDVLSIIHKYEGENIYAIAIDIGQNGLGYLIGTDFSLERIANKVYSKYWEENRERLELENPTFNQDIKQWSKDQLNTSIENIKIYYKWLEFDEFWHFEDFGIETDKDNLYEDFIYGIDEMQIGSYFERNGVKCLKELLEEEKLNKSIYYCTTYGENSRDMLRTATMIHAHEMVEELWIEYEQAEHLSNYS